MIRGEDNREQVLPASIISLLLDILSSRKMANAQQDCTLTAKDTINSIYSPHLTVLTSNARPLYSGNNSLSLQNKHNAPYAIGVVPSSFHTGANNICDRTVCKVTNIIVSFLMNSRNAHAYSLETAPRVH